MDYIRVTGSDARATGFIGGVGDTPQLGADDTLPQAIEDILKSVAGELTFDGLHARLVDLLQKPLPHLPAALDRLKAAGRIRETKTGTRLSYRWIAQAGTA